MPASATWDLGIRSRFWFQVEEVGDCWIWNGPLTKDGYGQMSIFNETRRAHRVAYVLEGGTIPPGAIFDHLCRNRRCVNPSHIRLTTHRENILAGEGACAVHARKTTCPRGHPYDKVTNQGGRACSQCLRELKLRNYHKNKKLKR